MPGLIGVVVDAMKAENQHDINKYCLIMFLIVVVSGITTWMRGQIFNTISERIA